MNVPVFDLHCDTALALLGTSLRECGNLKENAYHVDLQRAKSLEGYAQCFACFTSDSMQQSVKPVELFEREMVTVLREVEKNSDMIHLAYTALDIENNKAEGIMSAVLTIEGPAGFGYDPDLLSDLYAVGFRMTTLGWNDANPLVGSHLTGGGLSPQGRDYVLKAQKAGMVVDLSHISDEGFWDVIEITTAPVITSHSNSRNVCNHTRNLTDDMFLQICRNNGVAGMNFYKEFVGGDGDLNSICDHILHFLELDPDGMHIALGGDLDGCDCLCNGINGIQDYPKLADLLLARGVSANIIQNIFWNNAIGVMSRCCM